MQGSVLTKRLRYFDPRAPSNLTSTLSLMQFLKYVSCIPNRSDISTRDNSEEKTAGCPSRRRARERRINNKPRFIFASATRRKV